MNEWVQEDVYVAVYDTFGIYTTDCSEGNRVLNNAANGSYLKRQRKRDQLFIVRKVIIKRNNCY